MSGRFTMEPDDAGAIAQAIAYAGGEGAVYMEIGSLQGGSAILAANFAGEVHCLDIWGWDTGQTVAGPDPSPDTVLQNAARFGVADKVTCYTRDKESTELPPEMPPEFDVVFIDGNHTEYWARSDWWAVKDRTRRFVLFHDVHMNDERHRSCVVARDAAKLPEWDLVYWRAKMAVLARVEAPNEDQ